MQPRKIEIALENKELNLNKRQELFSPAHILENYSLKHNLHLLFCFVFTVFCKIFSLKNPSLHLVSKQFKKKKPLLLYKNYSCNKLLKVYL